MAWVPARQIEELRGEIASLQRELADARREGPPGHHPRDRDGCINPLFEIWQAEQPALITGPEDLLARMEELGAASSEAMRQLEKTQALLDQAAQQRGTALARVLELQSELHDSQVLLDQAAREREVLAARVRALEEAQSIDRVQPTHPLPSRGQLVAAIELLQEAEAAAKDIEALQAQTSCEFDLCEDLGLLRAASLEREADGVAAALEKSASEGALKAALQEMLLL